MWNKKIELYRNVFIFSEKKKNHYKHWINLEIFPANLKWAKLIKGLIFLPRRKTTAKNDRIRIATSSSINVERRGKKNWGLLQRWADTSGISRQ